MARILIVDDEEGIRFTLGRFLSDEGHEIRTARNYDEGRALCSTGSFDLVFTDIVLGGKTGVDLLRALRERNANCPVAIITGYPEIETAAEAVRLGAFDYLPKPVTQAMVLSVAAKALEHKARIEKNDGEKIRLQSIFETVRHGMLALDVDGGITEMNSAVEELCSLRPASVGTRLDIAAQRCGGRCLEAVKACLGTGESVERRFLECARIDRPAQVVNVSVFPSIDSEGRADGVVMVLRDVNRLSSCETARAEPVRCGDMVGSSRAMRRVYGLIETLARVPTTVLVTGESGTGKELVAEALHSGGERDARPFVKVNCAALCDSLLESELFGHVKGAFTGAIRDKIGRFQMADGGTLFLDEIGNISPRMQLGLLRVLQEREYERVGDATPVKANVRVISATNQDLRRKVDSGEFRQDLYYRLKVVEVAIPPLRDRREDIPLLIDHFLRTTAKKLGRPVPEMSEDVRRLFRAYSWPGNVRELEHAIEHAVVLSREGVITRAHVPMELMECSESGGPSPDAESPGQSFTRKVIVDALEQSAWNKARAARLLGVSQRTIYRKIKEFELSPH